MKLAPPSLCSGCHACVSICPRQCLEMKADQEGFLYPKLVNLNAIEKIDNKSDHIIPTPSESDISCNISSRKNSCTNCKLCTSVCPILKEQKCQIEALPLAYAAYNKEESVRLKSSSGGIFSLLAEKIISQGGVVFGATFGLNHRVEHRWVEKLEEISMFRTSKYVQSDIGNALIQAKAFLEQGRMVLFTGTPCEIGGLRSFLREKQYENLVTQDFICHGVPSPTVWQRYLSYQEDVFQSQITTTNFRDKSKGWDRNGLSLRFHNQQEYFKHNGEDLMMRAFGAKICLRPSCHQCTFKTISRISDITLADFWGIQSVCPEMDDNKGTSLVFLQSEVGTKVFESLSEQMVTKKVSVEDTVKYNPCMVTSVEPHKNRTRFFLQLEVKPFDRLVHRNIYSLKGHIYRSVKKNKCLYMIGKKAKGLLKRNRSS